MLGQCSMTQITRSYSPFSVSFILHPLRDDCTSSLSSILLDWLAGFFNATRDFTQDNISEGEVNCAKSDDAAPAAIHAMQTELSIVAHKLKKKMISIFGNGDVAAHHLALFRRASPLIKRIQLKLNWLRRITREGLTNTPIRFTLHTSVLFIDVSLSFACSKENPAFCSASSLLN